MGRRGVLVTGGSSGIGEQTVRTFASNGDTVWFTYRSNPDMAAQIVTEVAENGGTAQAFYLDQGNTDSHDRLLEQLPGPVDILVNNAAVGTKTVERYAGHSLERQAAAFMQINCVGPLHLIHAVLPGMLNRGRGKIINVCSVGGGIATFPDFHIADGMSKAAIAYMTKALAGRLVHEPVDIFALCPGAVDTPMLRASTLDALSPDQSADLIGRLPGGRLQEPAEIAQLIHWLCEPPAGLLHGAVLDASSGLGVHPGLVTSQRASATADADR